MNQTKKVLKNNNLTLVRADKTKAIVIINKDRLKDKVHNFIKENHMNLLNKDPTKVYQKQIHQAIQKCNTPIDKQMHRYLLNIKPIAPQLSIHLKTHKDNQPIRPVINNVQAPSYKVAPFMNKRLQDLFYLPYIYSTENSQEIVEELIILWINEHMRLITLDIKDMYVNLLITGIMQTASLWLNKHNNNNRQLNEQVLYMLNTFVKQNYFQYDGQIFQPEKGIEMGCPISSTIAEIYLQHLENIYIKHWLDSKEIIYYTRYVDFISITYDQRKIDEQTILHKINRVDENLQFKMSTEINNTINYLDTLIHRDNNTINIRIYRKTTETGTVIHLTSYHPLEQKISAFIYYINRLITLPVTEESKQKEWEIILAIARNNGYPINMIHGLKTKLINKKKKQKQQQQEAVSHEKKWITFTYFSALVRCVTSLFQDTGLKITFRAINTIQQLTGK